MERAELTSLIDLLQSEVNNGGFDQFFFNSSGDKTSQIVEALETISATKAAEIVKRAAGKFPGGMPPREWFKRQDVLLEQVSPEADAFLDLDKEFYANPENLNELLSKFSPG
jgi:hypothetical protein